MDNWSTIYMHWLIFWPVVTKTWTFHLLKTTGWLYTCIDSYFNQLSQWQLVDHKHQPIWSWFPPSSKKVKKCDKVWFPIQNGKVDLCRMDNWSTIYMLWLISWPVVTVTTGRSYTPTYLELVPTIKQKGKKNVLKYDSPFKAVEWTFVVWTTGQLYTCIDSYFDQLSQKHGHFVNLRQLIDYIHAFTHISTSCHSDNWSIINTNLSGIGSHHQTKR